MNHRSICCSILLLVGGCHNQATANTRTAPSAPATRLLRKASSTPHRAHSTVNFAAYRGRYYFQFAREHPDLSIAKLPNVKNRAELLLPLNKANIPGEIHNVDGRTILVFSVGQLDFDDLFVFDTKTGAMYAGNERDGQRLVGVDQQGLGAIVNRYCPGDFDCSWPTNARK